MAVCISAILASGQTPLTITGNVVDASGATAVKLPNAAFDLPSAPSGQPLVVNDQGTVIYSSAFVDVSANTAGADWCAKVVNSASKGPLLNAVNFPSGDYPCSVANAEALGTTLTSGFVLMGNYRVWLPLAISVAGTSTQPPQGTVVLNSKFGGFRGIGRGDTFGTTNLGTIFGVCRAANNPVTGCVAPDQSRIWSISSTSVSTVNTKTYLKITSSGMNLVQGESIGIDSSSNSTNNFRMRVCGTSSANNTTADSDCPGNPSSTVVYAVVPGTVTACSSSCGTLYGVLPVFDVSTPGNGNNAFGIAFENLAITCYGVLTCVDYRSMSANEQSRMRDVKLTGSPEIALYLYTNITQNSGPFEDIEILAGTDINGNCGPRTAGVVVADTGPHAIKDLTINHSACTHTPVAAMYIDTVGYPFNSSEGHCENFQKCVMIGQNAPASTIELRDWAGQSGAVCTDTGCVPSNGPYQSQKAAAIMVSGIYGQQLATPLTTDFSFFNIKRNVGSALTGGSDTIEDRTLSVPNISTDSNTEKYISDTNGGKVSLESSDATIGSNLFLAHTEGVQGTKPTITAGCGTSPSIVSGGTDNRFQINVGTGATATSCTVTFNAAFSYVPACVANSEVAGAPVATKAIPATGSVVVSVSAAWAASTLVDVLCF